MILVIEDRIHEVTLSTFMVYDYAYNLNEEIIFKLTPLRSLGEITQIS